MSQGTNLGSQKGKWIILAALVAVLGALLFLLPGGLVQAQSAEQFFTYPENGNDPVATFTASDPEGAMPVVWSLTDMAVTDVVTDAAIGNRAFFDISPSGVLTFKVSPSYEPRRDAAYRVTVQASDGENVNYFEAHVNVTDVEEIGKVTWTVAPGGSPLDPARALRQFQPGAELDASVTDPDAVASGDLDGEIADDNVTWKWYRSGTEISGQTEASYTVTDSDVGSDIRVTATYSDGSGPEESVSLTSETSVQAFRRSNVLPAFASSTVTRRVAENSTGNIGGPVVATDADGDTLTYAITGGGDAASFRIDPATGQLMVGPVLMINYEDETNDDRSYTVAVTAYDSSGTPTGGATAPVATVTINVVDEDEKPTFNTENTTPTENITRAVFVENTTELNFADYTATDPDDDVVSLSLMGDDAGLFKLAPDTVVDTNGAAQELSFKKSPDFEMPGDRNQDNVYEVTVRASAGTLSADRMVTVKVTNVDEDGKVTVSPETALLGVELTATLDDPEGSVAASGQITGERWTWHRGNEADFTDGTAIMNATSSTIHRFLVMRI